ncbi:kinesin family member 6/9 [Clonorchis sinensis]|uniref:Kinesin family member 6/9 n=1 Tax=Clonorchis sinensis TaxID=79923 RepID=G7YJE1_CLOSI|nr:kinesin family member 6/9 [Clonorchis sinensis]
MMTMILRDSLGGNCMTSMIANCSAEQCNIQETIATCRFAQRVALIKNDMILNEEQDPHVVIRHLKAEIDRLKAELAFTTRTEQELTEEEKERCERMVERFLSNSTEDEPFSFPAEMFANVQKICFCLKVIQDFHGKRMREGAESRCISETKSTPAPAPPPVNREAEELRRIIAQKDHEIHVLIGLLKRGQTGERYVAQIEETEETDEASQHHDKNDNTPKLEDGPDKTSTQTAAPDNVVQWLERGTKDRLLGSLSNGREQAFETFKREHHSAKHVEAQKAELQSLYAEAKNYANEMCLARNEVGRLQTKLNDIIHNETLDQSFRSKEFEAVRSMIEAKRTAYRTAYSKLRELRPRIEHFQHALETARVRLIQDFEQHHSPSSPQVTPMDTTAVKSVQAKHLPGDEKMGCSIRQSASSVVVSSRQVQKVQKTIDEVCKPAHLNKDSLNPNGVESYFGKIPLTGDPAVDADILAFVQAREELRRRQTEQ